MFARYALREVILGAAVGIGLTIAAATWLPTGFCIAPLLALGAWLWFFRDPPRRVPSDANVLLSPADGVIVSIEQQPTSATHIVITIFLSVFDVHVQRSPLAGVVAAREHRPGRFRNALDPRSSAENESLTLTLRPTAPGLPNLVRVRQIAGLIARRIVCRAEIGQSLAAGERYGMIKFGSRVELTLISDDSWTIVARQRQRVSAGETILLRRAGQGASPTS
ncbi:MAG: phosphatidylserine decarboxylase [Phycisphaerae bacterium]|nr:phosphatidylserine decarboxylase [Phycisphaerae bacterium]